MEEQPPKVPKGDIRKNRGFLFFGDSWENHNDDPYSEYRNFRLILEKLGIDFLNAKVLEVGSGDSKLVEYLKTKGINAVGIDARPRPKGPKEESYKAVAQARIEQLPFTDESLDVILSHSVFDSAVYHHNQDLMMKEISRVLKHGGVYIGSNENFMNTLRPIKGFEKIPDEYDIFTIYKKS